MRDVMNVSRASAVEYKPTYNVMVTIVLLYVIIVGEDKSMDDLYGLMKDVKSERNEE